MPYRAQVPPDSPHVGKTLQDLNFWHNTQATVVAISHDGSLRLSPGPYVTLKAGDVLYYLGSADCVDRVEQLFSTGA